MLILLYYITTFTYSLCICILYFCIIIEISHKKAIKYLLIFPRICKIITVNINIYIHINMSNRCIQCNSKITCTNFVTCSCNSAIHFKCLNANNSLPYNWITSSAVHKHVVSVLKSPSFKFLCQICLKKTLPHSFTHYPSFFHYHD